MDKKVENRITKKRRRRDEESEEEEPENEPDETGLEKRLPVGAEPVENIVAEVRRQGLAHPRLQHLTHHVHQE